MNKLFTKLAAGFIGLTMVASVGAVIGSKALEKNAVETNGASGDSFTFTAANGTSTDGAWSYESQKGSGSSAPTMSGGKLRVYPGNTITFTAQGDGILNSASFSGVVINKNSKGTYPTGWSVDNGSITSFSTSLTSCSVTGIEANSFTISIQGSAGNVNFGSVVMNYTGGSVVTYDVQYVSGEHGQGTFDDLNKPEGNYLLLPFNDLEGITANEGYRFLNYLVGTETKHPGDEINLTSDTTITVQFEAKPEGETTYDFETNFGTYASGWTGYGSHPGLRGKEDIGGDYSANIDLDKASKQSGTITTMPVFATKTDSGSWYNVLKFTLQETGKELDSVSVTFVQWSSRNPDVALFKGLNTTGTPIDTGTIGTKNTISTANSLGGNEFCIGYCDKSTSNIQAGLKSITITLKNAESFGTLDHIVIAKAPEKTTYHIGQTFNSEGLLVKAYDGADESTAHSKNVEGTLSLQDGHEFVEADLDLTSVTVSYTENTITRTADFPLSVSTTKTYDKATSISEGKFIIVDSNGDSGLVALAGYCDPLDTTGDKNALAVTDNDGSIVTGEELEVVIASTGAADKYSVQLKNGKYLSSPTGDTSGITTSDSEVALELTYVTDHFVLKGLNSKYLTFNSNADQHRFRFGSSSAGSTLQLYKEHQDTPESYFELEGVMSDNTLYYDDCGTLKINYVNPSEATQYPNIMASVVETDALVILDGEGDTYTYVTDTPTGESATFTLLVYAYDDDWISYIEESIVVTIIKPAALVDAIDYAESYFNDVCEAGNMSAQDWSDAEEAYSLLLDADAQEYLTSADYTYESIEGRVVPTAKVGTHSLIAKAMYQYDYCMKKYEYNNFMTRTPVYSLGISVNALFAMNNGNNPVALIVIVSVVGLTAVGAFLYIRRRKQHN